MDHQAKYAQIEKTLQPYLKMLGSAADTILDEDVSHYPIFVVYRVEIELGLPLLKKQGSWSVNASTLEELVVKRLVETDKVDVFRQIYKDPRAFLCLFVLEEVADAQFIFLPRVG